MSFHASTNTQRLEHGLWTVLTSLDGFEFPPEPQLTGGDLKDFEKVMLGKLPWRQVTEAQLAARVAVIFEAACSVFESENGLISNSSFYLRVAKKTTRGKLRDSIIFRQIIGTYVDGLKRVATRSESHVYVDRRSAPAALSVALWIDLTEGTNISITTKKPKIDDGIPPQLQPRKRRAGVLENGLNDREADPREIQLQQVSAERDQTLRELREAKAQIHGLTQEIEATKFKYNTQEVQLRDAKRQTKRMTSEWKCAEAKRKKYLKAFKASQRDREDIIANLHRRYKDRDSKYFALVEDQWREATRELKLAKQERDQSQRTLAECARIIKTLNSKLNGENGGV